MHKCKKCIIQKRCITGKKKKKKKVLLLKHCYCNILWCGSTATLAVILLLNTRIVNSLLCYLIENLIKMVTVIFVSNDIELYRIKKNPGSVLASLASFGLLKIWNICNFKNTLYFSECSKQYDLKHSNRAIKIYSCFLCFLFWHWMFYRALEQPIHIKYSEMLRGQLGKMHTVLINFSIM